MHLERTAKPKPARGSSILAREEARAKAAKREREEKTAAKKRDAYTCRWPGAHVCRGGLEAAHIRDASLGGEMSRRNLITVCRWIHRAGPESIHGKQLRIVPETKAGADWTLAFYRRDESNEWYLVAREVRPGVLERD